MTRSAPESLLFHALVAKEGIATPDVEHRFHPQRKWKFDFAWPEIKVAIEVEGRGRHQRPGGFVKDCEKYNTAESMGWHIYRWPASYINKSRIEEIVEEVQQIILGLDTEFRSLQKRS
jgi:very-short-patch-repair endonuclease